MCFYKSIVVAVKRELPASDYVLTKVSIFYLLQEINCLPLLEVFNHDSPFHEFR